MNIIGLKILFSITVLIVSISIVGIINIGKDDNSTLFPWLHWIVVDRILAKIGTFLVILWLLSLLNLIWSFI